ncbi:hypothetical protein ACIBKY_51575 [Nonomuraea sp. NPDC050394]|uniref:hypothetical protein n=1 Tax=Nonomuraea sp. NPDC050394 TaxID=3364363 RepID=UPI0037BADCDE
MSRAQDDLNRQTTAERVRALALELAGQLSHRGSSVRDDAAGQLALMRAADLVRELATELVDGAALAAARTGEVTYTQLGQAIGIKRQSARTRWPDAIPEAVRRPGKRPAAAPVAEVSTTPLDVEPGIELDASDQDLALPYKKDADPVRRRRWFTAAQLADVQVVATGRDDGSHFVIVAGYLLGTVEPHLSASGRRSGWDARHRGGSLAWHLGTGVKGGGTRAATRDKAVTNLISDVHHSWRNHQDRAQRDTVLREIDPT